MRYQGLKIDDNKLLIVVGTVRGCVKVGRHETTRPDLEAVIADHNVRLPAEARPSVNVYLTTTSFTRCCRGSSCKGDSAPGCRA